MPASSAQRWTLAAVCFVGLGLRLLYVWDISDQPLFEHVVVDQESYDSWALAIAGGDWIGDEVFYQEPFYPYLLGALYALFGRNLPLVYVLQSALSAAACLAVYGIGRRAFGDARVGLLAAALWAVYEVDFFYQAQILKTGPGTCLAILALWLLLLARDRPGVVLAAVAGVAAGLLPLDRGNFLAVVPLLVAWMWRTWWKRLGHAALRPGLALTLGVVAVVGTVAVRNRAVSGEWVLTTAQAGQNFYFGNNELANGRIAPLPFVRLNPRYESVDFAAEAERRTGRPMSAVEISRFWFREGVRWIKDNPRQALAVQWLKLRIFWYRVESPDNLNFDFFREQFSFVLRLPLAGYWLAAPVGAAGLALALWQRRAGMLALYVISYTATVIFTFVLSRYRMAIVPALLVFAAFALVSAWEGSRRKERATLVVLSAGFSVAAAICYPRWTTAKFDVAWSRVGSAHLAEHRYDAAIAAFGKSLEINPRLLHACIGLGQAYEGRQDEARARRTYEACAETNPASAQPHLALGILHARAGRREQAADALRRALAVDPHNAQAQEALRRLGYAFD